MEETETNPITWAQSPYFTMDGLEAFGRDEAILRYGVCTVVSVEGALAVNPGTMFVALHYDTFYVLAGDAKTSARIGEKMRAIQQAQQEQENMPAPVSEGA